MELGLMLTWNLLIQRYWTLHNLGCFLADGSRGQSKSLLMELFKVFHLVEVMCHADQLVTPITMGYVETPPFHSAPHTCFNEHGKDEKANHHNDSEVFEVPNPPVAIAGLRAKVFLVLKSVEAVFRGSNVRLSSEADLNHLIHSETHGLSSVTAAIGQILDFWKSFTILNTRGRKLDRIQRKAATRTGAGLQVQGQGGQLKSIPRQAVRAPVCNL
ncbi:hypothetical protein P7K49_027156 [Saguinus oedipus]|uniref:Uncharacterized protein n=1 Tax=Saguinus oedipus TaxID=9490 RepID=A0ABQ9UG49_SAGOE|nr:hypothetical protein P7K49_027156 [Saguinus oedipus]